MNVQDPRLCRAVAASLAILFSAPSFADEVLPPITVVATVSSGGGWPLGGGGGGAGGPTDFYDGGYYNSNTYYDPPPDNLLTCEYLDENWPPNCPRNQAPPAFGADGCGSGSMSWAVPDHHVNNPSTGDIFTGACDMHDRCYETFGGSSRSVCDTGLRNDMHTECAATYEYLEMPPGPARDQMQAQQMDCRAQGDSYHSALQSLSGIMQVAALAYDSSRSRAECRNAHELKERMGCEF